MKKFILKNLLTEQDHQPLKGSTIHLENPQILLKPFCLHLLVGELHHTPNQKRERLIRSFPQELMHSVSNGNFLTNKHCAVKLGLHGLTGFKQSIVYISRLGYSIG